MSTSTWEWTSESVGGERGRFRITHRLGRDNKPLCGGPVGTDNRGQSDSDYLLLPTLLAVECIGCATGRPWAEVHAPPLTYVKITYATR